MHIKNDVSDSDFVSAFPSVPAMPNWGRARRKTDFFATHRLDSPRTISSLRQSLWRKLQGL